MGYKEFKEEFPDNKMEEHWHEAKKKVNAHDNALKDYGMGKKVSEGEI
jgi:hypothetical protein